MNTNCEVITIAVNKGGVSKSTSAVNLAYDYSVLRHMKTLLIDMDPQGSVSDYLGIQMRDGSPTIFEALQGIEPLPIYELSENLSLVPSSPLMNNIDDCLYSTPGKFMSLAKLLDGVKNSFQRIIVDTPPHLGLATTQALFASDYLVIPSEPSFAAWKGVRTMKAYCEEINNNGGHVAFLGMFFTKFERLTICREVAELIERRESPDAYGEIKYLFRTKIRAYKHYKESSNCGQSIFLYAPESKAAMDSAALTDEIELRIIQYKAWKKQTF